MKLFFSGTDSMGEDLWTRIVPQCPWRLLSVHDDYLKNALSWLSYIPEAGADVEIMLDSGAFTAWTKGTPITVEGVVRAYAKIVEDYKPRVKALWLINLDVMPGAPGRVPSDEEITQALRGSDVNYEILVREFGPVVLPVYHQLEPVARLDEVVAMSGGYIGVSPRNDWSEAKRLPFVRKVHQIVGERAKTHGLGATGLTMMSAVPWHSTDSISWCLAAGLGQCVWWDGINMQKVDMSERDTEGALGATHWRFVHESVRASLTDRAAQYGFTTDVLREDHKARKAFNMLASIEFVRELECHEDPGQGELFGLDTW